MATRAGVDERLVVGEAFLEAMESRRFSQLYEVLGETMRMRAVLASGYHEYHGAAEVVDYFEGAFGPGEDFVVLKSEIELVADRLFLRYRFQVPWPNDPQIYVVENDAFGKVVDGRIVSLDLLCSGYRAVESGDAASAPQVAVAALG